MTRKAGDKKILIIYYSRTGKTKKIATDIAIQLNADTEEIIDKKNRKGITGWIIAGRDGMKKNSTEIKKTKKNPNDYDLTIIGTPVWAMSMTPAIKTYLEKNKNLLNNVAYFITSAGYNPEKIKNNINEIIGKKEIEYKWFVPYKLKNSCKYNEQLNNFINKILSHL